MEQMHHSPPIFIPTPQITEMDSRRKFLFKLAATAGAPALFASRALGQTPPPPVKLEETDPMAVALGYKMDTTKVDKTKYPQHNPEQKCVGCALYQEKAGEPMSPCLTFQGKLVTPNGWCVTFAKKPEPAKP